MVDPLPETVNATAIFNIEGTYDQITFLYNSSGVSDLGDENILNAGPSFI